MIDIEEELKKAQINYIQKELEQLRLYYDDLVDLKFLQILCSYEEMIELANTTDERLLLYKKMYQESVNYLFEEVQSVDLDVNSTSEDNENTDGSKENDKLPF